MVVDTHCHIFKRYYSDVSAVIDRAYHSGVGMIIVNGFDMDSNKEVLELVKKYDIVYGALGIQPEEVEQATLEDLSFIEKHINDNKIVAVGEIGLDRHYDCNFVRQKSFFKRQLDIAARYQKPVIIHSRDCIKETYDILCKYHLRGIMHCYSGSLEMAREFIKLGYFLGIGGIVTFKNARKLIDVIRNIEIEYIVLETDSPYLTPEPYRGKVNEPSNIPVILKKICEIKCLDYKKGEDTTCLNVRRLFDKSAKM